MDFFLNHLKKLKNKNLKVLACVFHMTTVSHVITERFDQSSEPHALTDSLLGL